MKKVVLFVLLSSNVFAQNILIKGKIVDKNTKEPIPYASVYVYNDKDSLINGILTNENGNFELNVIIRNIKIVIDFLGYDKYQKKINIPPEENVINLGTIELNPSEIKLQEVKITEKKELVKVEIDKIIYNVEGDKSLKGLDGLEVLQRVPTLFIDNNGNIYIKGNSNVKIFINGKPSLLFSKNKETALRSLQAEQIAKIEVITPISAKYEGEENAAIINIILKKKKLIGKAGKFYTKLGNIASSTAINVGFKWKKLSLQFSSDANYSYGRKGYSRFYMKQENTELLQEGKNSPESKYGSSYIILEYNIDTNKTLEISIGGNTYNYFNINSVNVTSNILPNYTRKTETKSNNLTPEISVNYYWEMDTTSKLMLNSQFSQQNITDLYNMEQVATIQHLNNKEIGNQYQNLRNFETQLDYEKIFNDKLKLETGSKIKLRSLNTYFSYKTDTLNYRTNTSENKFLFNQGIYSVYSQLTYNLKKFVIYPGFRYELTINNGVSGINYLQKINQIYGTPIPNISIGYRIKNNLIKLRYSYRITRPFGDDLNPFMNRSDPRSVSTGNPNLMPTNKHSIVLEYSYNISFFYDYYTNIITDYTKQLDSITLITYPVNAGRRHNYGINLFYMKGLFNYKLNISGLINIYYSILEGLNLRNKGLNGWIWLTANYQVNSKLSLASNLFALIGNISLQNKLSPYVNYSISARYYLDKKRHFSITINAENFLQKYLKFINIIDTPSLYRRSENAYIYRAISIKLSYKFGKFNFKDIGKSPPNNVIVK